MENKNVYLSLGSNLDNRRQNLQNAIQEIEEFAKITAQSSIYETQAVGYKEQGDFLNMAIKIETDFSPTELIIKLQEIEHSLGRNRNLEIKWGPRSIDIDILLYENEIIETKNLMIPHPRMHERRFVLEPLSEIAPKLQHPTKKTSIQSLKENLNGSEKVSKII